MRALLVDLDDTLLDYSGGMEECWQEACAAVAGPAGVDPGSLAAAIRRTRQWFWADPERHRRERADMQGAWTRITAHALAELGAARDWLAEGIARDFAERRWARMRLFPGVPETLDALRTRGVGLALVTNGDTRHQRRKIEEHGLARFFDVIVIEGEFGAGKPEEAVYRHALDALRARPREAWMVGDNLEWDVAAPQGLGLNAAWMDVRGRGLPAGHPVRPDRIIRAIPELLEPASRPP
ncbi:MAG TPA: HAD family hydrolase [Methylomirabilota bacterium]|nr:HAD family hydrolase [Methylomirabilota bacterium]